MKKYLKYLRYSTIKKWNKKLLHAINEAIQVDKSSIRFLRGTQNEVERLIRSPLLHSE